MNHFYGWTYVGRLPKASRRPLGPSRANRRIARRGKTLHMDMEGPGPARIPDWTSSLGRIGRRVIVVVLVGLSVVVLGKEESLRAEISFHVSQWVQGARQWLGQDPEAVAAGTRPESLALPAETQRATLARPLALISDKSIFLLDETGGIWPLPQNELTADLPVVTGLSVREEPGAMGVILRTEIDREFVARLLAVPFQDQLSEIHLGSRDGVILYTRDGIKILLRQSQHLDRDLLRLGAVLGDIRVKHKNIAMVDLRYDQHVVVRPQRRR